MVRMVKHKALELLFLSKVVNVGQINSATKELREFAKMHPIAFLLKDLVYSLQRLMGPGK